MSTSNGNVLKMEGVLSKGFGIIPKIVSLNTELPIESKAIYSYLVSFAGSGETAFPSISKIISDLVISKVRFYKYFEPLKQQGYITINKVGSFPFKNEYVITSDPDKLKYIPNTVLGKNKLNLQGMKKYGYGILPKSIMIDRSLSIESKAIYSYFSSFAGVGSTAIPQIKHILYHLNISETRYHKYLNELIEMNYISITQQKDKGLFTNNVFTLIDNPDIEAGKNNMEHRKKIAEKKTKRPTPQIDTNEESIDIPAIHPTPQIDTNEESIDIPAIHPTPQIDTNENVTNENVTNENVTNENVTGNITSSTSTSLTNTSLVINPSISDRLIDSKLSIEVEMKIKELILKGIEVPLSILNNPEEIDCFISNVTDSDSNGNDLLYAEVVKILKDLLKDKNVDRVKLLENLNEIIVADGIKSLYLFISSAVTKLKAISKEKEIKNLKAYGKTTILNYANTYLYEYELKISEAL